MINSTTAWASQLAALNAQSVAQQSAVQPNALVNASGSTANNASVTGSSANSLFSELISALTAGAVTVNGSGATSAASASGANSAVAGATTAASSATTVPYAHGHVSAAASADVAKLKSELSKLMTGMGGINASGTNGIHVLA